MNEKIIELQLPILEGKISVIAGKEIDDEVGEVILSGDPVGLKTLGKLLIAISEINQKIIKYLPDNESEHFHLNYGIHIGENKIEKYNLVISRLDMKNGKLKDYYIGKIKKKRELLEERMIEE